MNLTITLSLLLFTTPVSIGGFSNRKLIDDLIFYPPAITKQNQWYRFFTCGLIHADWGHLLFNMLSLYLFGEFVEQSFESPLLFGENGKVYYLALYVSALFFCLIPTFFQHRTNNRYRSLGASGAVSAIVFVGILFNPTSKIGFFFIPPVIPGYVFGPLYLLLSSLMGRQNRDNINHSAHIWGALYGLAFTLVLAFLLQTEYQPAQEFFYKVRAHLNSIGI
ncbi:MAG: rhomboid family intramembrane serine protease [Bacteroidetes bacterium]|nr:rhomboid family intramembrane serine protease [Bacteroidota bacterium]